MDAGRNLSGILALRSAAAVVFEAVAARDEEEIGEEPIEET